MKPYRAIALVAVSLSCISLSSCNFGGPADVVNPTVAELDRLDQQWGLDARKPRGTPKRTYRYSASDLPGGGEVPSVAAPAPSVPAPSQAPMPVAPAAPQLDPSLIDSLR